MTGQTVTAEYCDGIAEGRVAFREHGITIAADTLDTLNRLCRDFAASSPVGQLYRGERDFWRHQVKKHGVAR